MSGRNNRLKIPILNLIRANNGISRKELQERLNCHKNSILYNIKSLKANKKIDGPKEGLYYPLYGDGMLKQSYINLSNELFFDCDFNKKLARHLGNKQGVNRSNLAATFEKIEDLYENDPNAINMFDFEPALLDSIKITYSPERFYISNSLKRDLLHIIQIFLYRFLFDPSILHDITSLSDFNISFKILLGELQDKKLELINFKKMKKEFFDSQQLNNVMVENIYDITKKEHISRVQREALIKQQLDQIRLELPLISVSEFIEYIQMYSKLEFENLSILNKNLTNLREIYLKSYELSSQKHGEEAYTIQLRSQNLLKQYIEWYNKHATKTDFIKK